MRKNKDIKDIKLIFKVATALLVLIGALGIMYFREIKPISMQRMKYIGSDVNGKIFELKSGEQLSQTVQMQSDSFEVIEIMYAEFQGKESDVLQLEVANTKGEILQAWEMQLTDEVISKEEGIKVLYFNADNTIFVKDREEYILNLKLVGEPDDFLNFYGTNSLNSKAIVNGKAEDQALAIEILGGIAGGIRYFFLGISGLIVLGMGIIIIMLIRGVNLEKVFAGSALIFGIIYMFVIPPYAVPDEQAHFITAYNNSSELLGEEKRDDNLVVLHEPEILCDSLGYYPTKERYIEYMNGLMGKVYNNNNEPVIGGKALDMPKISYLPQTVGITIARILDLNGIQLFYMGRLVALITYTAIVYWAIKLMPFAKMLLIIVALLPMSMQQAMSYSYDMLVNAISFLIVAYFLYLIYEKEKVEKNDIIIISLCVAILAPIKVVYIVIVGLGILIPYQKFGTKLKKWICASILVLAGTIPIIITRITSMADMIGGSQGNSELLGYEVYGGMYFLKHLQRLPDIFLETSQEMTSYYMNTAIGKQLGWLEIEIPYTVIVGFILLIFISVAKKRGENQIIKTSSKIWIGTLVFLCCILVCFVLLISWTEVGKDVIAGVQGRYFLPIVPLFALLFRTKSITVERNIDSVLILWAGVLEIVTVLSVLHITLPR